MKITYRAVVSHFGRHRRTPHLPGQLTMQRFAHCPTCGVETATTTHGTALLCTEGHTIPGGNQ
ncbi:hypothetical protein [Streptomyces sp. NPDC058812]|uniref:hypothetical protein n=1 Tax=unclassified Streptomyces TaxID=2593676 RepID=UPI00367528FA